MLRTQYPKPVFIIHTPKGELEFPSVQEAFAAARGQVWIRLDGIGVFGPVQRP
jgi:hypothetical protein